MDPCTRRHRIIRAERRRAYGPRRAVELSWSKVDGVCRRCWSTPLPTQRRLGRETPRAPTAPGKPWVDLD